jgi:hypothetical protein
MHLGKRVKRRESQDSEAVGSKALKYERIKGSVKDE